MAAWRSPSGCSRSWRRPRRGVAGRPRRAAVAPRAHRPRHHRAPTCPSCRRWRSRPELVLLGILPPAAVCRRDPHLARRLPQQQGASSSASPWGSSSSPRSGSRSSSAGRSASPSASPSPSGRSSRPRTPSRPPRSAGRSVCRAGSSRSSRASRSSTTRRRSSSLRTALAAAGLCRRRCRRRHRGQRRRSTSAGPRSGGSRSALGGRGRRRACCGALHRRARLRHRAVLRRALRRLRAGRGAAHLGRHRRRDGGHRARPPFPADAARRLRLAERINWSSVQFLLENAVFLLIGLQVFYVLDNVRASPLSGGQIALAAVGTLVRRARAAPAVGLSLPAALTHAAARASRPRRGRTPSCSRGPGCAASSRSPAPCCCRHETPQRDVLVLIAVVVTVGTLRHPGPHPADGSRAGSACGAPTRARTPCRPRP